ncbi:MAG: ferredoxin [Acidimicrobiales bacterium]|nr:ferredoxin [Acidimicrobiales bacterium]
MKVVIDEDRCTGHGRCYALAPDLFSDDEYGNGQVNGGGTVPPDLEDQARRAVQSCPEQAITLE